jgi:hypothetical protein
VVGVLLIGMLLLVSCTGTSGPSAIPSRATPKVSDTQPIGNSPTSSPSPTTAPTRLLPSPFPLPSLPGLASGEATDPAALVSLPWVGTVYWRCGGVAGSPPVFSTTVVMNWPPGATITAAYELGSGQARSKILQPYEGQLSTPFVRSTLHSWTVVWFHEPGRFTTSIEIDFSAMHPGDCSRPPAVAVTVEQG